MNILIACNKPLPLKLEGTVLFQRGKIKPFYIRYGFFVEATVQNEAEFAFVRKYICDILCQYRNAEIELHTNNKALYRYFLQCELNVTYNCGSLYFYSAQPTKK